MNSENQPVNNISNLETVQQPQTTEYQVANNNENKKGKNKLLLVIVLIVALALGGYFILNKFADENNSTGDTNVTGKPTLDGVLDKGVAAYLNPQNLNTKCDSKNSLTNGNSGCMKWYVISYDSTNVNLILGHNTTEYVAWNSTGTQLDIPVTANAQLAADAKEWAVPARLPSADDISMATTGKPYDGEGLRFSERWLTSDLPVGRAGSNYWLSTRYDNNSTHGRCGSGLCAYNVSMFGNFSISGIEDSSFDGVRPIITVEKSLFGI